MAIKLKGYDIKLETKMTYSDKSNKYITRYIVYEKRLAENRQHELVMKWFEIFSDYGKAKVITFLAYYYKGKEGEADGQADGETEEIY